jgi:hypothetical protein
VIQPGIAEKQLNNLLCPCHVNASGSLLIFQFTSCRRSFGHDAPGATTVSGVDNL